MSKIISDDAIICPRCGSDHNHIVSVNVLNGDDSGSLVQNLDLSTEKEKIILKIEHLKNEKTPTRMIVITFACEACSDACGDGFFHKPTWETSFFNHKGQIFKTDAIKQN